MMEKSEIASVVLGHIQAFKAAHGWQDIAVTICFKYIKEEILDTISENSMENTDEKMLDVVNRINNSITLFVEEWEYKESGRYTLLPTHALTHKENLSAASSGHEIVSGGMSKAEIIGRIEAHIKTFEARYGWTHDMCQACIAGANMYIFNQISALSEENTEERMSDISDRLNKVIQQLVKGTDHLYKDGAFLRHDLYPKADSQTEEAMETHAKDRKMS